MVLEGSKRPPRARKTACSWVPHCAPGSRRVLAGAPGCSRVPRWLQDGAGNSQQQQQQQQQRKKQQHGQAAATSAATGTATATGNSSSNRSCNLVHVVICSDAVIFRSRERNGNRNTSTSRVMSRASAAASAQSFLGGVVFSVLRPSFTTGLFL